MNTPIRRRESRDVQAPIQSPSGDSCLLTDLGAETDRLNLAIQGVEDRLRALGVNGAVRMLVPDGEGDGDEYEVGFYKVGNAWRLTLGAPHDFGDFSHTPLLTASRALRVEAVKCLDELVDLLTSIARTRLAEVRGATDEASRVARKLDALGLTPVSDSSEQGADEIPF